MLLYIAGPMTGLPGLNFKEFDRAAHRFRGHGHTVVNPAQRCREYGMYLADGPPSDGVEDEALSGEWAKVYFPEDIRAVLCCDGVALLPGWERSRLGKIEVALAVAKGKVFFNAATGDAIKTPDVSVVVHDCLPKRIVVGFSGYATSGKDTAADAIVDKYDAKRLSFSDALWASLLALDPVVSLSGSPQEICDNTGALAGGRLRRFPKLFSVKRTGYIRLSRLRRSFDETTLKRIPDVRRLLQRLGTEGGRDIHGSDCWLKFVRNEITKSDGVNVVTNVRFRNEAEMIRAFGGIIVRVERQGVKPALSHKSDMQHFACDYLVKNDGGKEELRENVLSICGPYIRFRQSSPRVKQ